MTSLAFDTHASVKKLKEAGFTEQQAEAQVQVLLEIIESNLATKADIAELKHDLGSTEAKLRRDIELLRAETRRDLAEAKFDLIKWMVGIAIGAVIGMTGILFAMIKSMVPGA